MSAPLGRDGLAAGTPCWTCHAQPGLKVGTAVVTLAACHRDDLRETVTVQTKDGKIISVLTVSLSAMLDEEVEPWQRAAIDARRAGHVNSRDRRSCDLGNP